MALFIAHVWGTQLIHSLFGFARPGSPAPDVGLGGAGGRPAAHTSSLSLSRTHDRFSHILSSSARHAPHAGLDSLLSRTPSREWCAPCTARPSSRQVRCRRAGLTLSFHAHPRCRRPQVPVCCAPPSKRRGACTAYEASGARDASRRAPLALLTCLRRSWWWRGPRR